jgi:uncharacterized protein YqjF (DUF2071 family)
VAVAPVGPAVDGPLERFLTARWGLHVARLGRTWYLPNTHVTWPLRHAQVQALDDGLLAAAGLGDLARRPPDHAAFSEGVAATFGRPVLASTPRSRPQGWRERPHPKETPGWPFTRRSS